MSDNIMSALRFINYSVENIVFKRNYDYQLSFDEIELEFAFTTSVSINEEKDKAITSIKCVVFNEDFSDNKKPFYLETAIRGYFECQGDLDMEKFQLNSVAILFPYLRAIITSFTAQAGIPPIIIPAINVQNLLSKETGERV